MQNDAITVWKWVNAPEVFKKLSRHGGDEDWVAWVPPTYEIPKWLFGIGVCRTDVEILANGARILIGAHAWR